ncbi:MAG TPA: hypothetical protein VK980_11140 [Sphingomonas sp.]|nr:hypothetical protein [Sphingomonas sp.]
MTQSRSTTTRMRRHLFLGSAASALACAITAPAHAQTTQIDTAAEQSLVNDQANEGAAIVTDTGNARLNTLLGGVTDASNIALAGNDVTTTARGNRVVQDLATTVLGDASTVGATRLSAGVAGVNARAATLIANRQANSNSGVAASNVDSTIEIDGGEVSHSQLSLTDNSQQAVGLGNDAVNMLATEGNGTGAGIVNLQRSDAASAVTAGSFANIGVTVRDASASDLVVTGNREGAVVHGNKVANTLNVKATSIAPPTGDAVASVVPATGSGDPAANAAYAVLSNQANAGLVDVRAGGGAGFASGLVATGNVERSSLSNDDNALLTAGYGNSSANGLSIDSGSIARPAPAGTGAVANVTGVQRLADTARVNATTSTSTITHVFGDTRDSQLSLAGNSDQTVATGNLASANMLEITADRIGERQGDPLGDSVAGTALTTPAGDASVSAAFSVQNVQDAARAAIFASSAGDAADLEVGGAISGSSLSATGNGSLVAGTANSAVNSAALDATTIVASAGVDNLQTADGNVAASLGTTEHRAGTTISALGAVTDASLSVTGNSATVLATGNTSNNSLAITADVLGDGGGHSDAQAGALGGGYGAVATFALASQQKTGAPGNDGSAPPTIAAAVVGRFAIDGDGRNDRSSLAVEDDLQHAGALANDAVNRLSLAERGRGEDGARPAGAALSSSQYGEADVRALSDAKFGTRAAMSASDVSFAGNSNEAVATTNLADNALSVDATAFGSVSGGDVALQSGPLGPPRATGDHVLANQQFAAGSVQAVTATRFLSGDDGGGVQASRFILTDNVTDADAAANRARNAVSVTVAAGEPGNAGLVNTQMNTASVFAAAATNAAITIAGAALTPAMADSGASIEGNQTTIVAHGNVADNELVLSGGASGAGQAASAAIAPFDASVRAAGAVLNSQANYSPVKANASNIGYGMALNGSGGADAATLSIANNSVSAAAYGNVASNMATVSSLGRGATMAITNVQTNSGPVTAQATGANLNIISGSLNASTLRITGSSLAATAVGNQASSTIAADR